jgi:hypothetical protein
MHALTLTLALLAPQQQWTVDNGAPADFTEIADAIASPQVADGDTLLVRHGSYASFSLTRDLEIIGQAGTLFSVPAVSVDGAHEVTIAGLSTRELTLSNITGRVTLDECAVGWWELEPNSGSLVWQGECRIEFCAEVVIRASTFRGSEGCYPDLGTTRAGISALGSSLALVDCELYGGNDDICSGHPTEGPKPALELQTCFATLSACSLRGGDDVQVGAAPAALAFESDLRIRGSSTHQVRGGSLLAGGFAPAIAGANSVATISGVTFDALTLPAWAAVPAVPDPYLRFAGSPSPGSSLHVEVFGAAGDAVQVISGDAPRLFFLFDDLDPLWFQRVSLLGKTSLTTAGQDTPVGFAIPLPPGSAGAGDVTVFQAWLPQLGSTGAAFLSTPAVIVERW